MPTTAVKDKAIAPLLSEHVLFQYAPNAMEMGYYSERKFSIAVSDGKSEKGVQKICRFALASRR